MWSKFQSQRFHLEMLAVIAVAVRKGLNSLMDTPTEERHNPSDHDRRTHGTLRSRVQQDPSLGLWHARKTLIPVPAQNPSHAPQPVQQHWKPTGKFSIMSWVLLSRGRECYRFPNFIKTLKVMLRAFFPVSAVWGGGGPGMGN